MRLYFISVLGVLLLFSSCNNNPTTFFDIRYDDVDDVILHWKEHPYHNEKADNMSIDPARLESFINEFNSFKRDQDDTTLESNCYELWIKYVDGTTDKYLFDGHRLICVSTKHHYTCSHKQNLITEFWGITEKDFCVKHD